jgi:ADP-heptose:LPS heptosyltransferase
MSAVGDVVHALPALHALRETYPDAYIAWVVHPGAANLLENHPEIDELIILPRRPRQYGGWSGFRRLLRVIRGNGAGWDAVIDFQGLTKSGLVMLASGARRRIGFGNRWSRELNPLFVNEAVRPAGVPVVQMNIGLLEPLGVDPNSPAIPVLPLKPSDHDPVARWAMEHDAVGTRFLVIDPFAGWESKLWPDKHWVALGQAALAKWNLPTLVVYGPGEKEHAQKLVEQIEGAVLAPATSLRQFAALIKKHAEVFVAGDTGPLHLAVAAGAPAVALFGPSDSRRNAPTFAGARVVTLQDFSQPCAASFVRKCTFHAPGHCQDSITVDQVCHAIQSLMPDIGQKKPAQGTTNKKACLSREAFLSS